MFEKLVIIEPINMLNMHLEKLNEITKNVIYYKDIPSNDDEIIKRIDDADAVLLSFTSSINKYVLTNCKNVKYRHVLFPIFS